jgi:hypothetical protein
VLRVSDGTYATTWTSISVYRALRAAQRKGRQSQQGVPLQAVQMLPFTPSARRLTDWHMGFACVINPSRLPARRFLGLYRWVWTLPKGLRIVDRRSSSLDLTEELGLYR